MSQFRQARPGKQVEESFEKYSEHAAGLLGRGYSSITASHVLGIRLSLIESWLRKQDFQREVNLKARGPRVWP